ncbi:hypothetical protein CsSME_00015628 [Camellia sinensis var. sinensis]
MGKFRNLVDTPAGMDEFRRRYNIPNDVTLTLAAVDADRSCTSTTMPFSIASIVEGGVRFPLNPLLRRFFSYFELTPMQISMNTLRVINGVSVLNDLLDLDLGIWDILHCYSLCRNKGGKNYYVKVRSLDLQLVTELPDNDKHCSDFLQVGGNWEFAAEEVGRSKRVPRENGHPGSKKLKRRPEKEHPRDIKVALRYEDRSASHLLNYVRTYRHVLQRKPKVNNFSRDSLEIETEEQVGQTAGASSSAVVCSSSGSLSRGYSPSPDLASEMARRQKLNLDALVFGSDDEDLLAVSTVDTRVSSPPMERSKGGKKDVVVPPPPVATLALPADRASKRKRSKGKEVAGGSHEQGSVEEWVPPLEHNGRAITTSDSTIYSSDLAFDLSKTLLLPLDMAEQNISSDVLIKGSVQMLTACIQRMHIMDERRHREEQEKVKTINMLADADMSLKAAGEDIKKMEDAKKKAEALMFMAERRAVDADVALKSLKANYQRMVDEAEQRGYDEAEKTYSEEILKLRDKIFTKGWTGALRAAKVEEDSLLYDIDDIPVPSKTAARVRMRRPRQGGATDVDPSGLSPFLPSSSLVRQTVNPTEEEHREDGHYEEEQREE